VEDVGIPVPCQPNGNGSLLALGLFFVEEYISLPRLWDLRDGMVRRDKQRGNVTLLCRADVLGF
jgi:hypothetical protein